MSVFLYCVYGLLGLQALKVIFYDFPGAMQSRTWKEYAINVFVIVILLATLCGIGYLAGGIS